MWPESGRVAYMPATEHNKLAGPCVSNTHCAVGPGDVRSPSKPVPLYHWTRMEHSDTSLLSLNFEK